MRGIYDDPRYSEILKRQVAPDMSQVASALARKFRWTLQPEGNTALNALGLSTQIPAKYCYFSSGPNRHYIIDGQTLEFRKKSSRETAMRHPESMLVVHALKALGENYVTPELIAKLKARYNTAQWKKIKSDTTTATGWVYEIIRNIADEKEARDDPDPVALFPPLLRPSHDWTVSGERPRLGARRPAVGCRGVQTEILSSRLGEL